MATLTLYPIEDYSNDMEYGGGWAELADDTDSTYSATGAAGSIFTRLTMPTGLESGVISSISLQYRTSKQTTTSCTGGIRTHGTLYWGTTNEGYTGSYVNYTDTWNTNPYTGVAWTWDEIFQLIAGVTHAGYSYTSKLRVVVTYTLPSSYYVILRPTGSGTYTNIWTTYPAYSNHWDMVNDTVADDSSTYVQAVGAELDTYTTENMSLNCVVHSVAVFVRGTGYVWGTETAAPAVRTHSTMYYGTALALPDGKWKDIAYVWSSNPNTGASWTRDEVNDMEIGVHLNGNNYNAKVTQVFAVVYYTPVTLSASAQAIGLLW